MAGPTSHLPVGAMPITITVKKTLSKKPETLPEKSPEPSPIVPQSPPTGEGKGTASPIPFIDKISVVLVPETLAHAESIYTKMIVPYQDVPSSYAGGSVLVMAGSKAKAGEFKWARRIKIKSLYDTKKYPLLQAAYADKIVTKLRIEFVPVELAPEGMSHLHATLKLFVPGGWKYFISHGRITRIDIAVDFPNLMAEDFHFLPQLGATSKEWRVNGKLQTYVHGKQSGSHTTIYDRKEKRKAHKKSWVGKEGMRVERRIVMPGMHRLWQLPDFLNPFAAMQMVGMPKAPPEEQKTKAYVWDLFRRAVEVEGCAGALALLPEEKRTLYRAHLKAHTKSWWDPQAIWQKWPTMLAALKIAESDDWS